MTDESVKYDDVNDIDDSDEYEGSENLSIFQWIFLFVILGVIIYFAPMLFKLFS